VVGESQGLLCGRVHGRLTRGATAKPMAEPEPAALGDDTAGAAATTVRSLRSVAEQHGSVDVPATDAELQSLADSLCAEDSTAGERDEGPASLRVAQPAVPPAVAAWWRESRSWHFSRDHHDVFGFNVFDPSGVVQTTEQIFGDWENRADWRRDHAVRQPAGQPSVAGPGWVCLASLSEYDYLFCCFDSASPSFGHVRHMVNNCCEEWHAANDFAVFAQRLLEWHSSGAESGCWDDDALSECSPRPGRHVG
jgi:hypothetical protein